MPSNPMWYESAVDRAIREAQERGEFDDLPGKGKPLASTGGPNDELWWVRDYIRREGLSFEDALPPALKAKKSIERMEDHLRNISSQNKVREFVNALNDEIREAMRHPGGPAVPLTLIDTEDAVRQWSELRDESVRVNKPQSESHSESPRRRSLWRLGRTRKSE